MLSSELLDQILINASLETADPQGYVEGRRKIIGDGITHIVNGDRSSQEALIELQNRIEQMRIMNASPMDTLRELIHLIEERVASLEQAIREANGV